MTIRKQFSGVVPPMATPVLRDGSLDEPSTRRLIDFMVEGGVDGVFVLGTTGECASVGPRLRQRLVSVAAEQLRGRAMLYVGIGDNCFSRSVESAAEAARAGADALVAQLPSYYPLNPDEMFDYYRSLADRVERPLLVYNIPMTTHMSIPVETVAKLAGHPMIVGFKDSENSPGRLESVVGQLLGLEGFSLFMGVGILSARGLLSGFDGVVPGSGNLDPRSWREMVDAAGRVDAAETERLQLRVNQIAQVFQRGRTLGQSLAAMKAAMNALGLTGPAVLPPLLETPPAEVEEIRRQLAALGFSLA